MKLLEEKINANVSLKNILFATDFSAASEAALPYATAISLRYGGTVHVAHVSPESALPVWPAVDPATIGSIYEEAHSVAQEEMQRLASRLAGFPHHTYVRHGAVCEALFDIIHENQIDLLVAGTHGRTGVGKLMMGSVAEEILRQAPCPVFTVGPGVPPRSERHKDQGDPEHLAPFEIAFRQIVYTTNFTPPSLAASAYAFSLAREFRARLILLHVLEEYGERLCHRPGPIEAAFQKLEELVPEEGEFRHPPEPVVEFGSPADSILRVASESHADLIVLGARPAAGHLGTVTHFPGATVHKVIARANCPVLTVRG